MPDWYLDEPDLPEGSEFFLKAYEALGTCRSMDGPIPWTAARLYAEQKSLEVDVAELLWEVVHRMDVAEQRWHNANPPPKDAPPPPQQGDASG